MGLAFDGFGPKPSKFDRKAYNASPRGKAVRRKYRHDRSKYVTNAVYLSRPIVAIDGEGINLPDGSHSYVMLAISDVPPLWGKLSPESAPVPLKPEGYRLPLTTEQCLRYLFNHLSSENINAVFGASYDFNMMLLGLDRERLEVLYNGNYLSKGVKIGSYSVTWMKGKQITIQKGDRKVIINDVVSFFQCSFIDACDQYLSDSVTWMDNRELIVREKARRGSFTFDEFDVTNNYNQTELVLLVELVTELRARLNRVNLRPRRWNSPGAIASALFTREKIKQHIEVCPTPVAQAARFAYAGGRFEMIKYGSVRSKVYEYDINSAYPKALSLVPSLKNARWRHMTGDPGQQEFALYKVRYSGTNSAIPGPLFVRSDEGTVSFPLNVENWIWSPEMDVLREYCAVVEGTTYEVLEAWVCTPATHVKPFAFIEDLYQQRQALKAAGDGAQIAIKLALNSLYGKTAQQVGWVPGTASLPPRIPPYHCLEWAGFITSWTRANVLRACLPHLDQVIAFETDAMFSAVPLDVPTGTDLGDWEVTVFDSLTYVQSGHYYGTKADGSEVVRCRGVDKGSITRQMVEQALSAPENSRTLDASLTRFYGAGVALMRGLDIWCTWRTESKTLRLYPTGKRLHMHCDECRSDKTLTKGRWHNTFCPVVGGVSHEFPVEWINPNDRMSDLDEFRRMEVEYD